MLKDITITFMWANLSLMAFGFFVLLLTIGYCAICSFIKYYYEVKKELMSKSENEEG